MVSTSLGGGDSKKNTSDKKNQFTFFSFLANAKVCFIYSNQSYLYNFIALTLTIYSLKVMQMVMRGVEEK